MNRQRRRSVRVTAVPLSVLVMNSRSECGGGVSFVSSGGARFSETTVRQPLPAGQLCGVCLE